MICKNENSKIILETEGHKLYECPSCALIFSHKNQKENTNFKEVYSDYYKEENSNRFGLIIEYIVKTFRFIRAFKIYLLKPEAKSILDIGSGRGWMLYFLKKYFKYERTAGTQIALNAYKFSKENLKLEIYNEDLLLLPIQGKFDIITILHVLEHVENVELYMEKIYNLLKDDGTLLIEVPNYNSWTRKLVSKHWLALDLEHHLTFFTPKSLTSLLKKYNFEIKKIRTFSLEYSTFTSTQSIINLITNSDSYFFKYLEDKKFSLKIVWHTFLMLILALPCLLVNILLFFSKNGEVIIVAAQKNARY